MVIRECFLDVALWFNNNWGCIWKAGETLAETEGWLGGLCSVFIQEAELHRGFLAPSPASVASPLGLWPQGKCKQYNLFVTPQSFHEVIPGKVRTWEGLTERRGPWALDPLPPLLPGPLASPYTKRVLERFSPTPFRFRAPAAVSPLGM